MKGILCDKPIYIHNIYAPVVQRDQEAFYNSLPRLDTTAPQIAGGDFNNIIDRLRDDNSSSGQSNSSYMAFKQWRNDNGLVDTWRYINPDKPTEFTHGQRRIDLILTTDPLLESVYRIHHARKYSDHRSVQLRLQTTNWITRKHPLWRLHPSLHNHKDIKKIVAETLTQWSHDNSDTLGHGLIKEYEVLKTRLKKLLQALQHKLLHHDSQKRKELYKKVAKAKKSYAQLQTSTTLRALKEANEEFQLYKETQMNKHIKRGFQSAKDHSERCTTQFLRQVTSELHKRPVVATSLLDGTISTDED
jgi:Endonuclease-reverse transcriptase